MNLAPDEMTGPMLVVARLIAHGLPKAEIGRAAGLPPSAVAQIMTAIEARRRREEIIAKSRRWLARRAQHAARHRLDQLLGKYRTIIVRPLGGGDAKGTDIVRMVAERHGLALAALRSAGRQSTLVRARHEAMYLIALRTPMSLPQIGRVLGGRDHTTVIAGIRRHAERNRLPLPRGMRPPSSSKGETHADR